MRLLTGVNLLVKEDRAIHGCLGRDGPLHHPVLATNKADQTCAPLSPTQDCITRLLRLEGDGQQDFSMETNFEV